LNHNVFLAKRNADKQRLKNEILETRKSLAQAIEDTGFVGHSEAELLAGWDMFDQNASCSYFDSEWMFGVKGGFDIVIGNPPYVRRTSLPDIDKLYYESLYESATRQYDLYLLFIERGLKVLAENGFLSYINPIRFFNSDYGFGCRKFIVNNHRIISVLDISQLPVFQNVLTYPCVILVRGGKCEEMDEIVYRKLNDLKGLQFLEDVKPIKTKQIEIKSDIEYKYIIDVSKEVRNLIKKVDSKGEPISSSFDIARGLANNKVNFYGNKHFALKSTNVRRYHIEGDLKRIDTDYSTLFKNEMIILPRTVEYLQAMIKEKNVVCLDRIYYLIPKQETNLHFVLGIINSMLTNFWFEYYYKTTKVSGNYFDLNGNQIGSIRIPKATSKQEKTITDLVKEILKAKKENLSTDTTSLESEIDRLVYQLYGLTYDEVLIIDPRPPFTREEYERDF